MTSGHKHTVEKTVTGTTYGLDAYAPVGYISITTTTPSTTSSTTVTAGATSGAPGTTAVDSTVATTTIAESPDVGSSLSQNRVQDGSIAAAATTTVALFLATLLFLTFPRVFGGEKITAVGARNARFNPLYDVPSGESPPKPELRTAYM